MISRRTMVAGGLALAMLPRASTGLAPAAAGVSVRDYRRLGDGDDSAAFARALATGQPVHVPAGRYEVTDCRLPNGARIVGDGAGSVIRPRAGAASAFRADSGAAGRSVRGLVLQDIALEGRVEQAGFAEHAHLLRLDGVEDVLVERVILRGFQGDGIYLGSGIQPGEERHNRRVVIRACRFDGVNRDNRNAISIIDGEDIGIEDCSFANCTRPNMPGPIDLEPDAQPFAVIRRIRIENCQFANNGGNVGEIGIQIPAAVLAVPREIAIRGNRFRDYRGTGAEIAINVSRAIARGAAGMDVEIAANQGQNGHGVYSFVAAAGVRAAGNSWTDYRAGGLLGWREEGSVARDIAIADRFVRCGRVSGTVLAIVQAEAVRLDGTEFVDPGAGRPDATSILFAADGRSRGISLRNVRMRAGLASVRAVTREPRHRLDPSGNIQDANDFGAHAADTILGRRP